MRFLVTFLFLNQLSSNFAQGFKIGCRFLPLAQKEVLGTISDNITQRPLFYVRFLVKRLLEIALSTPKVPGDQKLFEWVRYILKPKVTKFQLPTLNSFWVVLKKKQLGDKSPPPKKNNRVNILSYGKDENCRKQC